MGGSSTVATILVVDDSEICRDVVRKSFGMRGMSTVLAADGTEGLACLEQNAVDAIVLDYKMPKMGGIEFLAKLRADERWRSIPVIMLTSVDSKDVVLQARQYRVSGYVLKIHLKLADLVRRVQQVLARPKKNERQQPQYIVSDALVAELAAKAAGEIPIDDAALSTPTESGESEQAAALQSLNVPNLLSRKATLDAVASIDSLQTVGGTIDQIKQTLGESSASVSDLISIVRQDPALAMRALKLACADNYGGTKARDGSLDDAVRTLGAAGLGELAGTFATIDLHATQPINGVGMLRCWLHAMAVASVMTRIVPKSDGVSPGLALTVGLCHNIAEILLRQRFPAEFSAALDFAAQAGQQPSDLFGHVFGIAAGDLTEAVLDGLDLPESLTQPIKAHEFPARHASSTNVIAKSLTIADYLAHSVLCTPSTQSLVAPLLAAECRANLISVEPIDLAGIRSECLTTLCMSANVVGEQAKALMEPLLPKTAARVWYMRDEQFAELDPIESALKSMCQVELHDRLPKADEIAGFDGLIVVAPDAASISVDATRLRTADDQPLPILLISGRSAEEKARALPGVEEIKYPVSLKTLSTYLLGLKT